MLTATILSVSVIFLSSFISTFYYKKQYALESSSVSIFLIALSV